MARNKPILPSEMPIEAVDNWTKRFNEIFKKRHYGELKSKKQNINHVNYEGEI